MPYIAWGAGALPGLFSSVRHLTQRAGSHVTPRPGGRAPPPRLLDYLLVGSSGPPSSRYGHGSVCLLLLLLLLLLLQRRLDRLRLRLLRDCRSPVHLISFSPRGECSSSSRPVSQGKRGHGNEHPARRATRGKTQKGQPESPWETEGCVLCLREEHPSASVAQQTDPNTPDYAALNQPTPFAVGGWRRRLSVSGVSRRIVNTPHSSLFLPYSGSSKTAANAGRDIQKKKKYWPDNGPHSYLRYIPPSLRTEWAWIDAKVHRSRQHLFVCTGRSKESGTNKDLISTSVCWRPTIPGQSSSRVTCITRVRRTATVLGLKF